MKRIAYILTAFLFLLCACQPTPEKEFIVSHTEQQAKPTENGGESVNPKVETDPSAIPARWEETMDVAGTKIVFEADVRTDEDARHPLYKVRHGRFGGETCLSMIESVFGKTERRMNQLSRDDIMEQIEILRLGIITGYDYNAREFITIPLENEEEVLAPYIRQLQAAPAEDTFSPLTAAYLDSLTYGDAIAVRYENGDIGTVKKNKSDTASENVFTFHKYRSGMIQPEQWVLQVDGGMASERPHTLDNITITEEEAISAADRIVSLFGRDDLKLAKVEKARLMKSQITRPDEPNDVAEGYYLHYAQAPKGYLGNGYRLVDSEQILQYQDIQSMYSRAWGQEFLNILVADEGIVSVQWINPMEVVGIETADVALLPFEEVRGRIRTLLEYGVKGSTYLDGSDGNIYVEEVFLSTMLRPVKDDPDYAVLEPAWVVRMETDLSRKLHFSPSFLIIDATDGSLIW